MTPTVPALPADEEHLRLLSIFHFVIGGLTAVIACFPVIHLGVGIAIVSGALDGAGKGTPPPAFMGWFFIAIASTMILVGWSYAIGMIVAGLMLRRRRRYTFCMIMAALSCVNVPLGTCLGVFTIVVLVRPSVKALFQGKGPIRDGWELG